MNAARDKALQQLDADYAPAREKFTQSRGMFETTAAYQARLEQQKEQRDALERKYQGERAEIESRYTTEFDSQTKVYAERIAELNGRVYRMDGVKLDRLDPGVVREVSPSLGSWLIVAGYAEPEMRSSVREQGFSDFEDERERG